MRAPKFDLLPKEIINFIAEIDEFKGRWAGRHSATSIGEAVAVTGANRNTVKVHFKNLVNDGHLEKEGVGRGMRYRMRS